MEKITDASLPARKLNTLDAIAIIVGIVIGAGIFRTPSLVAANTTGESMFYLAWLLGGLVSLIGALCYAELCTAFPNTGGDYHFIHRAFGNKPAFLFAWARMSVIQTGSIALLAYIFGDYLSQVFYLGVYSSVIYAAMVVIFLTGINIIGIKFGTGAQRLFTFAEVGGVLLIIGIGFLFSSEPSTSISVPDATSGSNALGLAMVFVLLTFGGWNEAAYISAELKSGSRGMAKVLVVSILIITGLYFLINMAYIKVLGHAGLAGSDAVAASLLERVMGSGGVVLIGVLVAISALTSANATIFTGARTNYALGKDFKIFSAMGKWDHQASAPVNAFLVQGTISLALIGLGLFTRSGFETIIEYTAPVFWFFFLMVGIALFVLRKKEPTAVRPFKVPLYPVLPAIFCLSSGYLLYSSLMYTGIGAFVGIVVLLIGAILLYVFKAGKRRNLEHLKI